MSADLLEAAEQIANSDCLYSEGNCPHSTNQQIRTMGSGADMTLIFCPSLERFSTQGNRGVELSCARLERGNMACPFIANGQTLVKQ